MLAGVLLDSDQIRVTFPHDEPRVRVRGRGGARKQGRVRGRGEVRKRGRVRVQRPEDGCEVQDPRERRSGDGKSEMTETAVECAVREAHSSPSRASIEQNAWSRNSHTRFRRLRLHIRPRFPSPAVCSMVNHH